jgi:putative ATP-binding cassette transporter
MRTMRVAGVWLLAAAALSVLSATAAVGLIAAITRAVAGIDGDPAAFLRRFAVLCTIFVLARVGGRVVQAHLLLATTQELRIDLSARIVHVPLARLEPIGTPALTALLVEDAPLVAGFVPGLLALTTNVAIVGGCLAFLGWLSPRGLGLGLALLAVGVVIYRQLARRGAASLRAARDQREILVRHLDALARGVVQLKLDRQLREVFLRDDVAATAQAQCRHNFRAAVFYAAAGSWGQAMFFTAMAVMIAFLSSGSVVAAAPLTGYGLTILYMLSPLEAIMAWLAGFTGVRLALGRIGEVLTTLELPGEACESKAGAVRASPRLLEWSGVRYTYRESDGTAGFTLGPIDLRLVAGEVVFIAGGNGSGKTTLLKLLTGLYAPEMGDVRLDGVPVTAATQAAYRELFSAVVSEAWVFERLSHGVAATVQTWLTLLRLDAARFDGPRLVNLGRLSRGTRGRVALLAACLRDRPIFVFDEWAAHQDRASKEIFYKEVLPQLRTRDRIVVVATHDEEFFAAADRVLRLETGKLSDVPRQQR